MMTKGIQRRHSWFKEVGVIVLSITTKMTLISTIKMVYEIAKAIELGPRSKKF